MSPGDRIRTFVQGFDEKLSGGIPKDHIVLLCGETGTLKSTIGFNALYFNAIRENIAGIYMSLEQGRESLTSHLRGLDLDPRNVEDKVGIVDLGMIRKNLEGMADRTWMEIFKMYAQNLKKSLGYELLVIDSLPVLEVMAKFSNPRDDLFQFFEWLRELKATTFIIQEMKTGSEQYGNYGEEFLSDGIIHLKMEKVDVANVERRIRCVKMRGTSHSTNYFTLSYQGGVLQIQRIGRD